MALSELWWAAAGRVDERREGASHKRFSLEVAVSESITVAS
jgi:hypothetical protein